MTGMNRTTSESGAANTWLILGVVFIFTTVAALGVMIWALINYFDQKNTVDTQVASAVSAAKKEQADTDEAKFNEREKEPNREFVGPEDYGSVSFMYPKTWSVYVDKDASTGSSYEAYLNPVSVPPIAQSQQYALRVKIESRDYDQVLQSYQSLVTRGDLSSSSVKMQDENGTRLDGAFSKDIRGYAVIFKIRDKTLTIRSDAMTFKKDFEAIIKSLSFNL